MSRFEYNSEMPRSAERNIVLGVSSLLMLAIVIPYLIAWQAGGKDYVFGGFLLNPLDGNSYLAKMYQGCEGGWKFHLPYTAESGDGAYLFLYYLFLGHVARVVNLPLVIVYHIARLGASIILMWALWGFFNRVIERPGLRVLAFSLAVFGTGSGWLATLFGVITSDLWVAEAFPFLSTFSNPHFPLGLAILVWMLTPREDWNNPHLDVVEGAARQSSWKSRGLLHLSLAILLGIILPFGVVVAGSCLGGLLAWEIIRYLLDRRKTGRSSFGVLRIQLFGSEIGREFIFLLAGGGPVLLYDLWVSTVDPVLSGWNQQNLTLSPPIWDLLIATAPVILLVLPGALRCLKGPKINHRVLFVWAALGIFLLYLPFDLQRRFMLGLFIPLVGLAAIGLETIAAGSPGRMKLLGILLIGLSLPTNLLILSATVVGSLSHEPLLFLSRDEANAMIWLQDHAEEDSLVLASPQSGLFIPAHTGLRVYYGHPFETVDAEKMKSKVELAIRSGHATESGLNGQVDYVFFGPRERELGGDPFATIFPVLVKFGEVRIYSAVQPDEAR